MRVKWNKKEVEYLRSIIKNKYKGNCNQETIEEIYNSKEYVSLFCLLNPNKDMRSLDAFAVEFWRIFGRRNKLDRTHKSEMKNPQTKRYAKDASLDWAFCKNCDNSSDFYIDDGSEVRSNNNKNTDISWKGKYSALCCYKCHGRVVFKRMYVDKKDIPIYK